MRLTWMMLLMLLIGAPAFAQDKPVESPYAKWEKEIAGIEQRAAEHPPTKQGIVFVGSSSIRLWDLSKSFPKLPVFNSGFGGSHLADSVHFTPRIVLPYEPKIVVLYAGDNDLHSGKTPATVAADFAAFEKVIHDKLPETKIVYIAVKPSIARWKNIGNVRETNKLIAEQCAQDPKRLVFFDIDPLMIGANGEPDPALFVKDGLHMSPAGYEKWTTQLLPHLELK